MKQCLRKKIVLLFVLLIKGPPTHPLYIYNCSDCECGGFLAVSFCTADFISSSCLLFYLFYLGGHSALTVAVPFCLEFWQLCFPLETWQCGCPQPTLHCGFAVANVRCEREHVWPIASLLEASRTHARLGKLPRLLDVAGYSTV